MTVSRIFVILAGLFGALGVGLAALAAHAYTGTSLASAATMLSLHAPALLGIAALSVTGHAHGPTLSLGGWGLVLGTALFSGDIACRVFTGLAPVPFAAPLGGSLLIVAWAVIAVAGLLGTRRIP
jgi:uncharacterized membrane protein YgdD (TMEM256/DUF423 family)